MNLVGNIEDKTSERSGRFPVWALILVLIGVFALLVNLNIILGLNWDYFWPILLIVIGVFGFIEYYYHRK